MFIGTKQGAFGCTVGFFDGGEGRNAGARGFMAELVFVGVAIAGSTCLTGPWGGRRTTTGAGSGAGARCKTYTGSGLASLYGRSTIGGHQYADCRESNLSSGVMSRAGFGPGKGTSSGINVPR